MAVYTGSDSPINNINDVLDLIEPIAIQAIHDVPSTNPLFEVFERESVDAGAEVEEILVGDANIEAYDKTGATVAVPRDVKAVARYYNEYEHPVYTTTVYRNEIRKVSLNPENVDRLAASIVSRLTATRDDDLYSKEKQVLVDMVTAYPTLTPGAVVAGTDEEMGKDLTIKIRNTIDAFLFKNGEYMPINVGSEVTYKNRAYLDRIRIIIPYNVKNALDVAFLANVYNLDKADLLSKIVTIDTTDNIVYVVDKFALFRYPETDELREFDNGEGNFINYFLHVDHMVGASTLFKFAYIDASALVGGRETAENAETEGGAE